MTDAERIEMTDAERIEIINFSASQATLDLIDAYYEEDAVPYEVFLYLVSHGPAITAR